MKEIDEGNLDSAIALGNAVCGELGICCEKRGEVIYKVYKKLQELRLQVAITKPQNEVEQPKQRFLP